jgi:hypothetical protein
MIHAAGEAGIQLGLGGVLLTILGGIVVAVISAGGIILAARQSKVASDKGTEIDERRLKLEETQAGRQYDAAMIARLQGEIERLEKMGHERAHEQAVRCRAIVGHLTANLAELVTVVRSEIDAEAAQDAIDEGELHVATDHPPDELDVPRDTDPPEVRAEPFGP